MNTRTDNWRIKSRRRPVGRPAGPRHGYTLVECLVALTLLSVTLATVTLTLHTLYQTDHRLRDELAWENELERFEAQLRSDAHVATSAAIETSTGEAPPDRLKLSLDGAETIEYAILPERIERTLQQADTVVHRESYHLSPSASAEWQVQAERKPPIVTLVLQLRPGPGDGPVSSVIHIDAAIQLIERTSTASQD